MRNLPDHHESEPTPNPQRSLRVLAAAGAASNAALHISTLQRLGAPRFLLDENAGGGGAGAGGSDAASAGAGGGSDANAGGAASAGAAAGGQPGGGDGSPSPYRPDGLPDHFAGSSDRDTIDKLYKAVTGFRQQQGDAGAVPANADGYGFDPSDVLKPYVGNFDKDPVYQAIRGIAHKTGMTDKMFRSFMPAVLEHFVSNDLVAAPVDPKAMLRGMAPGSLAATATDTEKEAAGARRVQDNIAWVDGAKASKTMPDAVADFFAASAAGDPRAHEAIEWLRGASVEPKPAFAGGGSGGGSGGGQSDADLEARLNDPRNTPGHRDYSQAFAEETDNLYRKRYG